MFLCILSLIIFGALLYGFLKLDCNPLLAVYAHYFPNLDRLKNKTVWIVGASSGIGEELAYQLAELNCRLILTSTTESKLQEVKEKCLKRSKNNLKSDDILVLAYDISNFKENDVQFKKIIDKFNNIDVLVNNAARIYSSRVTEDDFEQARKLFDINFFANAYIAKLVLIHWLAIKSKGQILATSSVGGYFDFPFFAFYTASKRAMNAFYRDLAQQQQCNGISVQIVMPGPTHTDLTNKSITVNNRKASFGENHSAMSVERTVELMVVALANRLNESWISIQPMLLLTYISDVFSYQIHFLCRLFNVAKIVEKKIL